MVELQAPEVPKHSQKEWITMQKHTSLPALCVYSEHLSFVFLKLLYNYIAYYEQIGEDKLGKSPKFKYLK
jgi:hypothetical protein